MRIACLLGPEFEDSEFRQPYDAFVQAGHDVIVIGLEKDLSLVGHNGRERVTTDAMVGEVRPDRFDALFIPGGHSPDYLRADRRMVDFVRGFRDKPIFAICHGPQLLLSAQMVRGRVMTAWTTVQGDLLQAGARVEDEEVVVDGNLVTSRKPDDIPAFVRESLAVLQQNQEVHEHPVH